MADSELLCVLGDWSKQLLNAYAPISVNPQAQLQPQGF